jgi:hypothetical protein
MQLDFHHAVTYVLARLAGFDAGEAEVVAYAAQYVDDANNSGVVRFHGDIRYSRISSAHRHFDQRNFRSLANLQVWIPFHFLPGNGGCKPGEIPGSGFIEKLRCTPDSCVAGEMIDSCLADWNAPYALHRLGITLHVYADTFAHQGFSGVAHESNDVSELSGKSGRLTPRPLLSRLQDAFLSTVIGEVLPLGHGAVLHYPDLPFAKWHYRNAWLEKNHRSTEGERDNPDLYMKAVTAIFDVLTAFRRERGDAAVPDTVPAADLERIRENLSSFTSDSKDERHRQWVDSISNGAFSFAPQGTESPQYVHKGVGSWKHAALGTEKEVDDKKDIFEFKEAFLHSNWKMFHDALLKHRFVILRDILPRYGICGA